MSTTAACASRPQPTMDELIELATRLADADERLLYQLIQARKAAGMSQRDVAAGLGIKQSSVAAFERHDNDPRLSTIRRYALAVGANVEHKVSCPSWNDDGWIAMPTPAFATATRAVAQGTSPQATIAAPAGNIPAGFALAA